VQRKTDRIHAYENCNNLARLLFKEELSNSYQLVFSVHGLFFNYT
jgi:hypothetical protein